MMPFNGAREPRFYRILTRCLPPCLRVELPRTAGLLAPACTAMAYDAMRLAPAGQNAWTLAVLLTALTVASSIIVALYRRGSLQLQAPRDSRSAAAKEGDRQPARQPRTTIRPYTTTELLRAASVALRSGDAAQARCESSAASSRQGRYTPGPAAGPATGLSEDSTSNTSLLSLGSVPRPVQEDFNRSDAWPSEVQPSL